MFAHTIRCLSRRINKKNILNVSNVVSKRNSGFDGWVYRQEPVRPPQHRYLIADGFNCFMWWWIFVHLYYDWGHIVGEFDYPEPEKWSDAELGVD